MPRINALALRALDSLGVALAHEGHRWSNAERRDYERATGALLRT